MSVRFTVAGLDALYAALRKLPEELRAEAGDIIEARAEAARAATVAGYPEVTGNLRRGVKVTTDRSTFGILAKVQSTARHAHLYEYGTRRTPPAGPDHRLGTHVARERRRMHEELAALLKRHGLEVSGE